MWDPGSLTRSPIKVSCIGRVLTTEQPGKFPSVVFFFFFWRPQNFSLMPILAPCTQEGAIAEKAGTSPLSSCTTLQVRERTECPARWSQAQDDPTGLMRLAFVPCHPCQLLPVHPQASVGPFLAVSRTGRRRWQG